VQLFLFIAVLVRRINQRLYENPDNMYVLKETLPWKRGIAFGWYDGKFVTGKPLETHHDLYVRLSSPLTPEVSTAWMVVQIDEDYVEANTIGIYTPVFVVASLKVPTPENPYGCLTVVSGSPRELAELTEVLTELKTTRPTTSFSDILGYDQAIALWTKLAGSLKESHSDEYSGDEYDSDEEEDGSDAEWGEGQITDTRSLLQPAGRFWSVSDTECAISFWEGEQLALPRVPEVLKFFGVPKEMWGSVWVEFWGSHAMAYEDVLKHGVLIDPEKAQADAKAMKELHLDPIAKAIALPMSARGSDRARRAAEAASFRSVAERNARRRMSESNSEPYLMDMSGITGPHAVAIAKTFVNDVEEMGFSPANPAVSEAHSAICSQAENKWLLKNSDARIVGAVAWGENHTPNGGLELHHIGSLVKSGGVRLLRLAVDDAIKNDEKLTFFSTPQARGFYLKLGFREVGGRLFSATLEELERIRTTLA
jgi:hypothetical protein